MKQGPDQQIACKPAGRRRGFHQWPRRPARSMPGERRGFTLEIKDMGRFDKAIRPRHASGAHLLRERSACYTCVDSGLDMAAAVEPGAASARQEGIQ
jgi:hypothetical protein